MNSFLKQISVFVGLVLFQTLVLNNINIHGVLNPYSYILFILLMPIETSGWAILILSLAMGLSIDVFAGTMGMHAFATVMLGGLRQSVINILSQKGQDLGKYPSIKTRGFTWMALYMSILTFIHHFAYFFIESWSAGAFKYLIYRIFLSVIMSVFIMILFLYAFKSSDKK